MKLPFQSTLCPYLLPDDVFFISGVEEGTIEGTVSTCLFLLHQVSVEAMNNHRINMLFLKQLLTYHASF